MNFKFFLIIFISLQQVALSQSQLKFNNPKLGIGELNEIFFTSEEIGYGIGSFNKFCKTTDGGRTWSLIDSSPIGEDFSNFASIFFLNENLGYLTSKHGKLFKTVDGGLNLTELHEFDVIPFERPYLHFFSEQRGIIKFRNRPDLLYTTNDGGLTWQNKPNDPDDFLFIHDESLLYSNDGRNIYKSTDFAESWTEIGSIPFDHVFSIQFLNEMDGFIYGFEWINSGKRFYISRTQDGGNSWETNLIHQDELKQLEKVYFIDENKGFGVNSNSLSGEVFETNDGGKSWLEVTYSIPSYGIMPIRDVFFLSDQTGFMVSDYGLFLSTEDAGDTWSVNHESITSKRLNAVSQIDQEKLIIVGNNGSILLKNNSIIEQVPVPTTENLSSVDFSNSQFGVVVGQAGSVFLSTSGGTSWEKVDQSSHPLNQVTFSGSKGLICGNNGIILKSEDSGNSWLDLSYKNTSLGVPYHFTSSIILDEGELLVFGHATKYNGFGIDHYNIALKSFDNGATWIEQDFSESSDYSSPLTIEKISAKTLLMSTSAANFKSTDAGDTWTKIETHYTGIRSIYRTANNDVYGITDSELIRTIDEGETWSIVQSFRSLIQYNGRILDFVITETDSCFIGTKGLIISNSDFTPSVNRESVIKTAGDYLTVSKDELSLNSSTKYVNTFEITSNLHWTIESDQDWLTVFPKHGSQNETILVSATENPEAISRTGIVTVLSDQVTYQSINVTQDDFVLDLSNIKPEIKIYPNPVKDVLQIDTSMEGVIIKVFNLSGNLCIQTPITDRQINLSKLSAGMYIIHISSHKENFTKTIIKQ